jgi:CheY-like chemotaxis protein
MISFVLEKDRVKQLNEELKKANEKIASIEKFKSAFLSNLSLELRTPLNTIIGFSEILQEDVQSAGLTTGVAIIMQIIDSAKSLLDTISDVNDLSNIESGDLELYLEDIQLNDITKEIKQLHSVNLIDNADINVLHTDPVRIKQALHNLLGNLDKIGANSTLEIKRASNSQDMLQFALSTSDSGMNSEQLGKLFDAFSHDITTAREYGNVGLKLYLARRLCEMLGGGITLESKENNSAVFSILIPVKTLPETTHSNLPAKFLEVPKFNEKTILIIDNTPHIHKEIQEILGKNGSTVLHAYDGVEGLKLARLNKPRVIVLDVPETITIDMDISSPLTMDGWATLSALKGEPGLSNTPIIVMSMISENILEFTLGGIDRINKPIDISLLIKKIQKFVPA